MVDKVNSLTAGFKKIPGISIDLASKALSYGVELDIKSRESGEVHVRPMSISDEMAMKTPDLLISGEAIESVINNCVDEVYDASKLYACDINTLLVAIRIATGGEMMTVRVTNPYYDKSIKHSEKTLSYELDLRNCIQNAKMLDSIDDLTTTLDNGQVVVVRPLTFEASMDLIKIEMDGANTEFTNDAERSAYIKRKVDSIADTALTMIVSVDDVTDHALIKEWYNELPANLYKPLKTLMDTLAELGPDLEFDAFDPTTKNKWKSKIPINPLDFFDFG